MLYNNERNRLLPSVKISTSLSLKGSDMLVSMNWFISGEYFSGRRRSRCATNSAIVCFVSWSRLFWLMRCSFRVFCPKKKYSMKPMTGRNTSTNIHDTAFAGCLLSSSTANIAGTTKTAMYIRNMMLSFVI